MGVGEVEVEDFFVFFNQFGVVFQESLADHFFGFGCTDGWNVFDELYIAVYANADAGVGGKVYV